LSGIPGTIIARHQLPFGVMPLDEKITHPAYIHELADLTHSLGLASTTDLGANLSP
jgi:hypothetical protein